MTATYQQRAYEQLFALSQALRIYDGLAASLRDNKLEVTRWQEGGKRRDVITCSPRPSDGDRLWFWDSARKPVAEAHMIPDAALAVSRLLG